MMVQMKSFTLIKLGGSIIVPHLTDADGIDVPFLNAFRKLLLRELRKEKKIVLVAGGGRTARVYQKAARELAKSGNDSLDWIGIHAIYLNAYLLKALFGENSYEEILTSDLSSRKVASMKMSSKGIVVSSGWMPGWSTDYVAVRLAQKFGAKEFIDAGDIDFVYDKDPKVFKDAKPIKELSWAEYRKLIPAKWTPGLASPIDPVAAKLAQKANITAKILKGTDLENLKKAIEGKEFTGTLIS
ncbi:MAG TPA: UMP kinase [Candidatus Wildermuthbacteria bacterium]|uniref:Uridylate kinase n=1 Tax=Candidatus Yanofskybacteria bacterium GW2011_GWC1_48_11 TaxID=1619027 RepID=A0A837IKT1_9BACT|nr:MAG: Aspartate/glutamate/uridylate kinase [Candidatus Yanofskybacteria bacterium GW2011_GWC1_48_11]KKW04502.1 MAG: Aspartate/glutamate/uridylate kinase [Parcubacteria group bacterium GW2011_GWB1_49_12]KKW09240.1 MAG: Aspartate/glutamate/uridylate kinase [Parcubacteria group bacterium GW2011_GWA1_49_26]KKW14121.1 MAG: Aspartate/glutamate/uridylate kinase [Parcubacteria group bacterium GW2011_GWA2_50_10]HCM36770.1 UMP kinase [Candidatus Wildermuthbacteria bacterium]